MSGIPATTFSPVLSLVLVSHVPVRFNLRRNLMAKGQMRPKKEVKKPKKDKADKGAKAAPASFEKGISATGEGGKKKG